ATVVQNRKVDPPGSQTFESQHDELAQYKGKLPKAGGDGLPSEDLKKLSDRIDALSKKLEAAMTAAKAEDGGQKGLDQQTKAVEDLQKQVHPLETGLSSIIAKISADLDDAKSSALQYEIDVGTPEGVRLSADVAAIINVARRDYNDEHDKPLDAKTWAAKP